MPTSPLTAYVYSPVDFAFDCYAAGFRVGGGLVIIIAIAGAETAGTFDPKITNTAGNTPPSIDRGILEMNSYWHPEVSDECAFDPKCAAKEGWRISKQGSDFSPWSTYANGSYQRYLPVAWMAVDAMQRIQTRDLSIASLKLQAATLAQQLASRDSQIADLRQHLADLTADDQSLAAQLLTTKNELTAKTAALDAAGTELATLHLNIDSYLDGLGKQLRGT